MLRDDKHENNTQHNVEVKKPLWTLEERVAFLHTATLLDNLDGRYYFDFDFFAHSSYDIMAKEADLIISEYLTILQDFSLICLASIKLCNTMSVNDLQNSRLSDIVKIANEAVAMQFRFAQKKGRNVILVDCPDYKESLLFTAFIKGEFLMDDLVRIRVSKTSKKYKTFEYTKIADSIYIIFKTLISHMAKLYKIGLANDKSLQTIFPSSIEFMKQTVNKSEKLQSFFDKEEINKRFEELKKDRGYLNLFLGLLKTYADSGHSAIDTCFSIFSKPNPSNRDFSTSDFLQNYFVISNEKKLQVNADNLDHALSPFFKKFCDNVNSANTKNNKRAEYDEIKSTFEYMKHFVNYCISYDDSITNEAAKREKLMATVFQLIDYRPDTLIQAEPATEKVKKKKKKKKQKETSGESKEDQDESKETNNHVNQQPVSYPVERTSPITQFDNLRLKLNEKCKDLRSIMDITKKLLNNEIDEILPSRIKKDPEERKRLFPDFVLNKSILDEQLEKIYKCLDTITFSAENFEALQKVEVNLSKLEYEPYVLHKKITEARNIRLGVHKKNSEKVSTPLSLSGAAFFSSGNTRQPPTTPTGLTMPATDNTFKK